MTSITPAVRSERQLLQAQIRSLGLASNAAIELTELAGSDDAIAAAVLQAAGVLEARHALVPFRDIEFRDASGTGDGSYTLTGYAAVYGQETVLYDSNWWRFREVIAPGAFDQVLAAKPDVHFNSFLHDFSRPIARTGIDGMGGLELSSDDQGLRVFARLNPLDPDVIALSQKMPLGIVDQMSFMFTIANATYVSEIDEETDFEDELRTINQIGELYDVLVCAQGAYPQTSAELAMRTLTGALGRAGVDLAGLLERRGETPGVESPVAPEADADTEPAAEPPEPAEAPETPQEPVDAAEAGDPQRARKGQAMRMRVALDD